MLTTKYPPFALDANITMPRQNADLRLTRRNISGFKLRGIPAKVALYTPQRYEQGPARLDVWGDR